MTICLALLCDNGRQVVAAADRMVSVDSLSLEYEQSTRKVELIGSHFVALTAGDALAHTELLRKAVEQLERLSQPSVHEVAAQVEASFIAERQALAEKTVLLPAGLDYDTFIEKQSSLTQDIAFGLMNQYQSVRLDLEVLVAGVDDSGGHLYLVEDLGVMTCFDSVGFAAVGSGLPHAESFLAEADYSPAMSVNRAIWLCYVAKRRSERAPGVGKATDLLVIDNRKGAKFLGLRTMSSLEEMYQKHVQSLRDASAEIDTAISGLKLGYEEDRPRNERKRPDQG